MRGSDWITQTDFVTSLQITGTPAKSIQIFLHQYCDLNSFSLSAAGEGNL